MYIHTHTHTHTLTYIYIYILLHLEEGGEIVYLILAENQHVRVVDHAKLLLPLVFTFFFLLGAWWPPTLLLLGYLKKCGEVVYVVLPVDQHVRVVDHAIVVLFSVLFSIYFIFI